MSVTYYAAYGIEGGSYELVPCASRDEARRIARDRLGPLLKSTDDEVFLHLCRPGGSDEFWTGWRKWRSCGAADPERRLNLRLEGD